MYIISIEDSAMMILVTYPNHVNVVLAKDQNGSVNFYRYKFGHRHLGIE